MGINNEKKYKNLIFDVGNVLFHYRWTDMMLDYGFTEEEATDFGSKIFGESADLWNDFDIGIKTFDMIKSEYCERYPEDTEAICWFLDHPEYMHKPIPAVWKMFPKLKEAGYMIYLLSNYSEALFTRHTEYADFMPYLDGKIVSYEINKIKPDHAIYEELFSTYGLDPAECIFFDDRAVNVEASEECGMDAYQVTDDAEFVKLLEKLAENN